MSLLEHRKKLKAKKPKFIRRDGTKKLKLSEKWRRPKGLQNKLRLRKRGYGRHVEVGWRSPKMVRGLDSSGLQQILIYRVKELENLNSEKQGVIIASNVGAKNKLKIIKACQEAKIKILNIDAKKNTQKK